jgi:hypothetical protein
VAIILVLVFLVASLGTLLAAFSTRSEGDVDAWLIAMATMSATIASVLAAWMQYEQMEQQVRQKSSAAAALRAVRAGWRALPTRDRSRPDVVRGFVEDVERILEIEHVEWSRALRQAQESFSSTVRLG